MVFYNNAGANVTSFDLDTTRDYWFIMSSVGSTVTSPFKSVLWLGSPSRTANIVSAARGTTTDANGGTGWTALGALTRPLFEMPRRRSQAFNCWDTKALNNYDDGT